MSTTRKSKFKAYISNVGEARSLHRARHINLTPASLGLG